MCNLQRQTMALLYLNILNYKLTIPHNAMKLLKSCAKNTTKKY